MTSKFILLLGAGLIWLTNPPAAFSSILVALGFDPESAISKFSIGLGVAGVLMFLAWLSEYAGDFVVRFFARNHPTGIWLYSYAPKPNAEFGDERPTVGIFSISKRNGRYSISDGESYQIRENGLLKRGEWTARNVTRNQNSIEFVYNFESHRKYEDEKDPKFKGHIHLICRDKAGILGPVQSGMVNDLDERSHVWGPIHAEKVSKITQRRSFAKAKLEERFSDLYAQLD